MGTPAALSASTSRWMVRSETSSSLASTAAVVRPRAWSRRRSWTSRDARIVARIRRRWRHGLSGIGADEGDHLVERRIEDPADTVANAGIGDQARVRELV